MRIFSRITLLITVAFVVFLSSGCDPDTPGLPGGVTLPPIVSLNSGAGLVSFNQELALGTPSFIVSVSGQDGDALLRDLVIQEAGVNIPFSQLNYRTGQTANNPLAIPAGDQEGFTYEIEITPSNAVAGPVEFTFRLTDVDNETASTFVTITYTSSPPVIDLLVEDGFVSGDATVTNFGTSFDVKVNVDNTEDSLASLTILEDGVVMDAAQLTYFSPAFAAANPLNFIPAEALGGTFSITIDPDVDMMTSRTYTFQVADVNGITAERSVVVTFDPPAGTALGFDTTGVFFNASGGMAGGLDLDNGMAVAFNSADAEVQDEGINLNVAGENWRTQISSVNDAVVKVADLSVLGENVSFDDVSTAEEIASVYDGGADLTGDDNFPDADGDQSANEEVSLPIQEGDVFVIRRGDRSYLLRIDAVNFVGSSNNDSYSVSIKW